MDQLIKGNQLITDFLLDENVPFVNKTITDTMKKLLSPLRASGHVTKVLKVTQTEITIKVNEDEFTVSWLDEFGRFYVGIARCSLIEGYLYIPEKETKKKTVQTLRDIFGVFRARLDFDKKYPEFFTTF